MNQLSIVLTGAKRDRPLIPKSLITYFENWIQVNIILPYGINLGQWKQVHLLLVVIETGKNMALKVELMGSQTTSGVRQYAIVIPIVFLKNCEEINVKFVELMFEAAERYFVGHLKKMSQLDFASLMNKIDWDYVRGVPPAKDDSAYLSPCFLK